jgi:hypothetical protein
LLPIGGWVSNTDTDYLSWPVEIEVSEEPFEDEGYPGTWLFYFRKQLITAGVDKALFTPALLIKPTAAVSQNPGYRGSLTASSPTAMTNITMYWKQMKRDLSDDIRSADTGEMDSTSGSATLPALTVGGMYWRYRVLADSKVGPEEGDVPADTIIRVEL